MSLNVTFVYILNKFDFFITITSATVNVWAVAWNFSFLNSSLQLNSSFFQITNWNNKRFRKFVYSAESIKNPSFVFIKMRVSSFCLFRMRRRGVDCSFHFPAARHENLSCSQSIKNLFFIFRVDRNNFDHRIIGEKIEN